MFNITIIWVHLFRRKNKAEEKNLNDFLTQIYLATMHTEEQKINNKQRK